MSRLARLVRAMGHFFCRFSSKIDQFSRRRRFFGGEFLYRVRFLRTSAYEICGAVQRPLRPCFTPLTLLFLCRFVMSRSSPFFCATVRRWASPGSFSNILLHVYKTPLFCSMATRPCITCWLQTALSRRVLGVVHSDFTGDSTRGGSCVFW